MAGMLTETALKRWPWNMPLHTYGALICNPLVAGSSADHSPIHEAALHGRLLSLRRLIGQGFSVNAVTLDGVSPLHEACLGGHATCAKLLVEHGANVNAVTIDGATPHFHACCSGSAACLNVLLEHGSAPSPTQSSPIHEAAKRGHMECMEILLANGVDIDLETPQLGTPLYAACTSESTDCVEKLLHLGASVHLGRAQDTPLHAAARKNSVRVVELLTDYGADVLRRNHMGERPLDLAAPNSPVESTLKLRKGPASLPQLCRLSIRDSLGRRRLHAVSRLPLPRQLSDYLLYR
ncbi:hypothetical protein ANANG_G00276750 [Anguilla anguilla]|uniref:Ankyrin repeat and SOCS box protein 11 n=1 Tax=Anguilla anguilla TaxID=7936 RepID=A0A9D3RMX3_ANGAN|nr:hypothetical protein ANANG_G00276750 [Anguilla anguilla]